MKTVIYVITSSVLLFGNVEHLQKLYNEKQYQTVLEEAKHAKKDYSKLQLHLLWAKSAQALGDHLEAMLAYERVLILDPQHNEAQKELANIYLKLKRYKLALTLNNKLKQKSEEFKDITLIDQRETQSNFSTHFSLSEGYDSNVNVHNESDGLDTFYASNDHTTKLASFFYQATAQLSYLREFENHFYLKTSLNGYYKIIFNDRDYSLYLNTLEAGLGYYQENFNLYLPLSYSFLNYLGEDYLQISSFEPQIDYKLTNNFMIGLSAKLEKRTFKTDSDRDDKSITLGLSLNWQGQNTYLFLDTEFQDYRSDSDNYQDFSNKKSHTFIIGMGHNFTGTLKAIASYKFTSSDYEDNIGTEFDPINEMREDSYHQLNFKLSKQLDQSTSLFIENEYSINHSNFIPADYSKNTLQLGFSFNY